MSHTAPLRPNRAASVRGPRGPASTPVQGPQRLTDSVPLPSTSLVRRQIPADSFADVLRDPGSYSELYPDVLPLTRKLHRQLRAQLTSGEFKPWPMATDASENDAGARLDEDKGKLGPDGAQTQREMGVTTHNSAPQVEVGDLELGMGPGFSETMSYLDMNDESDEYGGQEAPASVETATPILDELNNVLDMIERGAWVALPSEAPRSWVAQTGNSQEGAVPAQNRGWEFYPFGGKVTGGTKVMVMVKSSNASSGDGLFVSQYGPSRTKSVDYNYI